MKEKAVKIHSLSDAHAKWPNSKWDKYVSFILNLWFGDPESWDPEARDNRLQPYEDRSKYPIVVTEAPGSTPRAATVIIKNSKYTFPKDLDFSYSFRGEINEETGYGFELIKEKLCFKNLPGVPTLIGLAEEKNSGMLGKMDRWEMFGNYQLTGTGIFKNVKGAGLSTYGASTGFVVHHVAWIKGWPL